MTHHGNPRRGSPSNRAARPSPSRWLWAAALGAFTLCAVSSAIYTAASGLRGSLTGVVNPQNLAASVLAGALLAVIAEVAAGVCRQRMYGLLLAWAVSCALGCGLALWDELTRSDGVWYGPSVYLGIVATLATFYAVYEAVRRVLGQHITLME
jgi:hypothetical protein